jgi:hypothetical protein
VAIAAALDFEVSVPGQSPVHGSLRGRGNRLVLTVDDPGAFAGGRDAPVIRSLADAMAARGILVRVESSGTHLVTLGATTAPWWQRRATGTRHIRLGSLRGAWTWARARGRDTPPVLPDAAVAPPATLFPIAPPFQRGPGGVPTTTHDPARGGGARLVMAMRDDAWPGDRQAVFWLDDEVTVIGSDESCDVRLPGLQRLHAEIRHDERDEFVLLGRSLEVRVNGARTERQVLRTGSRVTLGRWTLAYYREEYADHGRPYGGRIGGELGRQRRQPGRETLQQRGPDSGA